MLTTSEQAQIIGIVLLVLIINIVKVLGDLFTTAVRKRLAWLVFTSGMRVLTSCMLFRHLGQDEVTREWDRS